MKGVSNSSILVMSQEPSEPQPKSETPRQQAEQAFNRLKELILDVDAAANEAYANKTMPPSDLIQALMEDAAALLEGIKDGWIETSQPRIASNLLAVVGELEKCKQGVLAAEVIGVLRNVSRKGLTAENVEFSRKRMGNQTGIG